MVISFDGEREGPSVIRYNVPLPGRYTGQRVVQLDLGLEATDFNSEYVSALAESIKALDWKKTANSSNWTYNADRAAALFADRLEDVRSAFTSVSFGARFIGLKNPDGTLATLPPIGDEILKPGAQAAPLTRREKEIAPLVAQGLSNRQIAAELHLSEHTVATHVRRILKKLGFHSRADLAAWVSEQQPSSSDLD